MWHQTRTHCFLKYIILKVQLCLFSLFLFYVSVKAKKLSFWMPKFCEMNRACLEGDIWEQKKITVTNNCSAQCCLICWEFFCCCNQERNLQGQIEPCPACERKAHLGGHGCSWWCNVCAVLFHASERRDRHTTAFLPLHKQTMTNRCNIIGIVIGIWGAGHLIPANVIDDLSISFFFFFFM